MLRIAIVAGEMSGDLLGAGLIKAIKHHYPDAHFEGIAGPTMIEAGCVAHYPMERLAVMGLVEILKRYRELKKVRSDLIKRFINDPPDVFIGIDAPEFNTGLEYALKQAGIPTVHYVSPSVWAWRQYRLRKIKKSVDLMLTLFPFEARYYQDHDIAVHYVGHPLSAMIPLVSDKAAARAALKLADDKTFIAILPGSRTSEVTQLADDFIKAAWQCQQKQPDLSFIVPLVNEKTRAIFQQSLSNLAPALNVTLFDGQSRQVMAAADVILMACGTATLEAMLIKRPMVVAYRLNRISYWLAKLLVNLKYFSLPNLLSPTPLVPEFIQDDITADKLSQAIMDYLNHPEKGVALVNTFHDLHLDLRKDASKEATTSILSLLKLK